MVSPEAPLLGLRMTAVSPDLCAVFPLFVFAFILAHFLFLKGQHSYWVGTHPNDPNDLSPSLKTLSWDT